MNEQNNLNNQINNQFDNQTDTQSLEMPREHVKKKFFSFINTDTADSEATGAFVPKQDTEVTNAAFSMQKDNNLAIETLDDTDELEVLDDLVDENPTEELDVLDEKVETPELPKMEGAPVAPPVPPTPPVDPYPGYVPSFRQPTINQGAQVDVYKPHEVNQNLNPNFGYNTQGVQPGAPGLVNPVPPQGAAPAVVAGMVAGAPSIQSSAIFQAANQQPSATNVTPANNVVDTTPAPQWMSNQPLSASNIENTTVQENNVMSANKREELERQKNEPVVAVPEEVIKPKAEVNIRPELLVKEYIGEDYTSLTMAPLNFGVLIFGAAYYAYRKLYIWALINIIISGAILFFVPINYNFIALLGFHLLMGLSVNRIYILHVKLMAKRIAKRNAKKKVPKTQEELENNMRIRGRVSFINGLLAVCLYAAGVIALSLYVIPNNDFSKLINKAFSGNPFKTKSFKYDGNIIYDKNYNVNDLIEIRIPDEMLVDDEILKYNVIDYSFVVGDAKTNNTCSIKVGTIKDYDNGNSYVVKIAAYNEEENKVNKSITNSIEWTNYYTEDNNYQIYYKGATINNRALLLEYRIGKNTPEGTCGQHYINIMESIKIKEG